MIACNRPGCTGVVDETGYCDRYGHPYATQPPPPVERPASGAATAEAVTTNGTDRTGTTSSGVRRPSAGSRLTVELPWIDEPADTAAEPADDLVVPERHRKCGNCGEPVGRGQYGQPGRTEGSCWDCGAPYSFVPKLSAGEVLADRYRVVRPLGHGGLSWAYQAIDVRLDRPVVLKGLIRSGDLWEAESIHNERAVLTVLDHPGIVRIFDFVSHAEPGAAQPTEYIVMEYAGVGTLQKIKEEAYTGKRTLLVRTVIGYGIWILDAFAYLHDRGLLYCDLKPENALHQEDQLKLIDMGAVRAIGDRKSPAWGTKGFQVPKAEVDAHGLTVRSDLYTVGKTLRALFAASVGGNPIRPSAEAIRPGIESFQLLLARAEHEDRGRRFESAAAMSEQLRGVLREIDGLDGQRPDATGSLLFGDLLALLDDELSTAPPLATWTSAKAGKDVLTPVTRTVDRPGPRQVAISLPDPRPDPSDVAAGFLAGVNTADPQQLLRVATNSKLRSVEIELLRCRAHLAAGEHGPAERAVGRAAGLAGSEHDWRIAWHRGLLALYRSEADQDQRVHACHWFTSVRGQLPGEPAPRLALGFVAEHRGLPGEAAGHFTSVWQSNNTAVSAAFGLARCRLARGDRRAAVDILDEVPQLSRHYEAARIAAIRVLAGHFAGIEPPTVAELADAFARLTERKFVGSKADRARLRVFVTQSHLVRIGAGAPRPEDRPAGGADGVPLSPTESRLQLAALFSELAAWQADSESQHDTLIDLANLVRPRTRW